MKYQSSWAPSRVTGLFSVVLSLYLVCGFGCAPHHKLLKKADFKNAEEKLRNASYAAGIARDDEQDLALRCYAFDVIGKLGVYNQAVREALNSTLPVSSRSETLRSYAAWALGEVARKMTWDEPAKDLHEILIRTLQGEISAGTAYYAVEALGKYFPLHEHTFEENVMTVNALNSLASGQTEPLPGIYYLVLNRIATLESMIELVREAISNAEATHSNKSMIKACDAVLSIERCIERNHTQLVASFPENRELITAALIEPLNGLNLKQRFLSLMLIWYTGRIADDPAFAQVVSGEIARYAIDKDPTIRLVTAWSLVRLASATKAREALRESVLGQEIDARILEFVHSLRVDPTAPDIIQRLYNIDIGEY